jgi:esterase
MTQTGQAKFVTLNNLKFHYLEWGEVDAKPLVLLHGFTSHAHSWATFAQTVQERYHVYAVDQRGHGESAWADDYTPERMVEDLEAFVQTIGLTKFSLLGLSMGGRNAYAYTALHPEKIEKLVIVDIGPELMTTGSERIRTGVLQKDEFDSPEEAFRQARAGNARADETELRQRVQNNLMQLDTGKWTYRYDKKLRSPDRPLARPDSAKAWLMLTKINCPTLLVRGAESDLLSEEVAERMTQTIPNCQLVTIPKAGHSVPLDNPTDFSEAVGQFL